MLWITQFIHELLNGLFYYLKSLKIGKKITELTISDYVYVVYLCSFDISDIKGPFR